MAAELFFLPFPVAFSSNGLPVAGAKLYFYLSGTSTPVDTYTTAALTTEHANPVVANGAGRVPTIYLDDTITYRLVIRTSLGVLLDDIDPYIAGSVIASIGSISGSVTVTNRTLLAALPTGAGAALLEETGRGGMFVFDSSDLSDEVAADVYQGIYVAPTSDPTGNSGAWVREPSGRVDLSWFGVSETSTLNKERIESAIAVASPTWSNEFLLPQGEIEFDDTLEIDRAIILRGRGGSIMRPGTQLSFPAGCTGILTTYDPGAAGSYEPIPGETHSAELADFSVVQKTRLTTTTTITSFTAATRTIVLPSAGDWETGQVIRLEGAGITLTIPGITATTTNGSPTVAIASAVGNPGVHIGQRITIAGASIPAGTTVLNYDSTTITLSANAGATVSGAAVTVVYPMIATITAGGGTTSLTVDAGNDTQDVTGSVLYHFDPGIAAQRPIQGRNLAVSGFWCGRYLRGDVGSDVPNDHNVNTSHFTQCRSSGVWAALVCAGADSNASSFHGDDYSFSSAYGVLDLSVIGNAYIGAHFAFAVGIAAPRASCGATVIASYFEDGTSFVAAMNTRCTMFGCYPTVLNGRGWLVIGSHQNSTLTLPSITIDDVAGTSASFSNGVSLTGTRMFRAGGAGGNPVGGFGGKAVELFQDGTRGFILGFDRAGSAYIPLTYDATEHRFDISGVAVGTVITAGFNLANGKVLQVNGSQVVGARKTGWTVATGTATRTTFDTATVTLPQLAERLKALIDDLHATAGHGVIGT